MDKYKKHYFVHLINQRIYDNSKILREFLKFPGVEMYIEDYIIYKKNIFIETSDFVKYIILSQSIIY